MTNRIARVGSGAFLLLLLVPAGVSAHAEFVSASPAPDSTVEGSPAVVEATFTESMDPQRSRFLILDAEGQQIAEGRADPADQERLKMVAQVPPLGPGTYEVRWTTVTPDDNGVERGRYRFEVAQAAATPTPTPTAAATSPPIPTGTLPADGGTPTPTSTALGPSGTPSTTPTTPPSLSPSPPSPSSPPSGIGSGDSVIVPLAGLALVAGLGVVLMLRRRAR